MRSLVVVVVIALTGRAGAAPLAVRCSDIVVSDFTIDGLLDDWQGAPLARTGSAPDGAIAMRCAWDGTALAIALDIADDRVVRVKGKGHEDHVTIAISAGGKATTIDVAPGNSLAKARIVAPGRTSAADSLQPKGFSIEARVPASALAGFSGSTPALDLHIVFHDSDQATGGDDTDVPLDAQIVLGERADLLDDFLATVHLRRGDVRLDTLAELDLERKGKERIVAGGTVIGVLTDKFAFVQMPAAKPGDVRDVKLLPLGPRGQQVVAAIVRELGNGGSRDLLMMWTVHAGQLQPLAQIEIRKELDKKVLEASYRITAGAKPELVVEPRPAIGFTAETWNEDPPDDADAIVLPWDAARSGVGYTLKGAELVRRDLKKRR